MQYYIIRSSLFSADFTCFLTVSPMHMYIYFFPSLLSRAESRLKEIVQHMLLSFVEASNGSEAL